MSAWSGQSSAHSEGSSSSCSSLRMDENCISAKQNKT